MAVLLIYLIEGLGVVPLVLIFREFIRDMAAGPDMGKRWKRMEAVISEPTLPSDLIR